MRIPMVFMRGGTSKAAFFHEADLPHDPVLRDKFFLAAFGSPDAYGRQIDGIGGAVSSTSKVAVIGDGKEFGVDVTYEFGQVSIDKPLVDRRSNCGNISSAVGPFAVDEGLVTPTEPITLVRILNTNTQKVIVAHVPTKDGRFDPIGDFHLPGIPVPASPVQLDFLNPGGAVTGRLLPTGNPVDDLLVPDLGTIAVSVVDAANPAVFVRWEDLGLSGLESPAVVSEDRELLARLEAIRAHASVLAGIADTIEDATYFVPSVPKIALVGTPRDYMTSVGEKIRGVETGLRASIMSMGRMHNSYPLTGAIATTVAAHIPGTLVHEVAVLNQGELALGHPSGVLTMAADVSHEPSGWTVNSVTDTRSARRLMEGHLLVPDERLG